jgi:acyl-CoA thioester hydrolase
MCAAKYWLAAMLQPVVKEKSMEGPKYPHELELDVRDYECDLQGVVNNAVYLHYLEHARHDWLRSLGLDFSALHRAGIDLVAVRVEIDYRFPLRSGDRFAVRSSIRREGRLKLIFLQEIYRVPDQKPIVQARVVVTGLQNGRPALPDAITGALEKVLTDT